MSKRHRFKSVGLVLIAMSSVSSPVHAQRAVFDSTCEWMMKDAEVDAIILGGTDLALVYSENQAPFPVVDCAAIHVDAIVRHATTQSSGGA